MALTARMKRICILSFSFLLYLVLGMVLFVAIEDNSSDETSTGEQEMERQVLKNNTLNKYNMSSDEYNALYQAIQEISADYTAPEWSYEGGFSFVVQVVTTIGYGNLTPVTTAGQILCIFYALFGIPLCVLFLQATSEELLKGQRKLFIKLEVLRGRQGEPRHLNEKCVAASFILALVLIFIGAGIQCHLEHWSFLEGVYCYFVTFTTIGFGDFIPGERIRTVLHFIRPFYVIFGLVVMANIMTALVGCGDSVESLKRLFRCKRGEMEEDGKGDMEISMKNRSTADEVM